MIGYKKQKSYLIFICSFEFIFLLNKITFYKMSKKVQAQKYNSLLGFQIQSQKDKQVYIYAEVDIDKLYFEITTKSKKVLKFLQDNNLQSQFLQKMRQYKNLRICFDNEIQQFIHKKQLNKELKNIKKSVFTALEDFLIGKFNAYLQEQKLHSQYEQKVKQIQSHFQKRLQELTKEYV